ncbi:ATP-binding protein [Streptomyces sp. NPDC056716]|uniref:ATP-binding protein n=1 Tax=unclassified Streptomyces TaxID=2593676 RepID=UPI00369C57E1
MTTAAVRTPRTFPLRDTDLMNERIQIQPRGPGARPRPEDASRVGALRRIAAARLRWWGLEAVLDDAVLVLSELATNAVLHTGTPEVRVAMVTRDSYLCITVTDGMPGAATLRPSDGSSESGRGLGLVAAIAAEHGGTWGVDGAGERTWCRLALPGVDRGRDCGQDRTSERLFPGTGDRHP